MDEERFCPLKQNTDDVKCDKEKCAWFDTSFDACSVKNVAGFLSLITNALERRNQYL